MSSFDVSQEWTLLLPQDSPAVLRAGKDLARIISLLRIRAGIVLKTPALLDSGGDAPDDSIPIILLNRDSREDRDNGFSWRSGASRVEIYGNSNRGLCNGIYDFLGALGVVWGKPETEELPQPNRDSPGEYPLARQDAYRENLLDPSKRRRMLITRETSPRDWEVALLWAFRNQVDGIILPLDEQAAGIARYFRPPPSSRKELIERVRSYSFIPEAGGWVLSFLMPRSYFLTRRELFRMDGGKRVKQFNFCPTNQLSQRIFRDVLAGFIRQYPYMETLHLWPDRDQEKNWCSCPTCRAFTPEEQNRIAVNAAADILRELEPRLSLSFYENPLEPVTLKIRENLFPLKILPGQALAENWGMFFAERWRQETFPKLG